MNSVMSSTSEWAGWIDQSDHQAAAWPAQTGTDHTYYWAQADQSGHIPLLNLPESLEAEPAEVDYSHSTTFCTHPLGCRSCAYHSPAISSARSHHSSRTPEEPEQAGEWDFQRLSARDDNDKQRKAKSLPPSVECYIQDPQAHERFACGRTNHADVGESERYHKRRVRGYLYNKDMKVVDRRPQHAGHGQGGDHEPRPAWRENAS